MGFRGGNTPERLIQFDLVILNKSHTDDFFFFSQTHFQKCTEANSDIAVGVCLVFALFFPVKVPEAISSSPSPSWLMVFMQQNVAPIQAGLHPSTVLFQCAFCFAYVIYWKTGMALLEAVHVYIYI